MSQHQQNWRRINAELRKAVKGLEGPIAGRPWSDFDMEMETVFSEHITAILEAELNHRMGDESKVNVRIKESLIAIGEEIVRRGGGTDGQESIANV